MNKEFMELLKEGKVEWAVRKFENDEAYKTNTPYEVARFDGNVMLNEGINELWTIVCSASGTDFDNTSAYLGVGDDATTEAASQTGLSAVTNKVYVAMESGFPTYGTSQKATWKSSFGSAIGNHAWAEFTVANGNSNGAKNLNRKVSAQGTKTAGQTWELALSITLS